MFHLSRKRTLAGAGALAAVGALAMSSCMVQNGKPNTLTLVGSDTTQNVMGAISTQFNGDASNNKDPDTAVNVFATQSPALDAPADAFCGDIKWDDPAGAGEMLAPNGSSAGRDALKNSVTAGDGCVDIARSSATPRPPGTGSGQDPTSFEYYAYAMDAVTWASASSFAPANLSLANLQDIYKCNITDWHTVNPAAPVGSQIKRYWPQAGSGTRSFFQSSVLANFDPTTVSSGSCPAVTLTEENSGATIAANGDQATAIVPFSAGNWISQNNHATTGVPDVRHGQVLGQIDGNSYTTPSGSTFVLNTAGPVKETNIALVNSATTVVGIRYVFNVIDNTTPDYGDAKYFVGFENLPPSDSSNPTSGQICNGSKASTISTFGFAPLDTSQPDANHNQLGSNCRLYTPTFL
jgi:phosphate transport system substrate-binding protein